MGDTETTLTITLKDGTQHRLEKGRSLLDIAKTIPVEKHLPILCAKVDNDVKGLDFCPEMDCRVEFLDYRSPQGMECYRRSTGFILARAALELYRNARLVIGQSVGNAFYYDFYTDVPVSEKILQYLTEKMREIIGKNEVLKRNCSRAPRRFSCSSARVTPKRRACCRTSTPTMSGSCPAGNTSTSTTVRWCPAPGTSTCSS